MWLARFFRQPSRRYRDFQLVFALLTLNFTIPALSYTFTPEIALGNFEQINALLGGQDRPFPEVDHVLWRYLAAANVMTLGFMCALLMVNLKRFFPVLVPLVFMKMFAALSWCGVFLADTSRPVYGAAALLDLITSAAFVFFATRARRDLDAHSDEALVPQPLGARA